MIVEPFWGGHPFFTRDGLDQAVRGLLDRNEGLDYLEVHMPTPGECRISGLRRPDFTPPPDLPPGRVWLPNPMPRGSVPRFSEMDGAAEVERVVTAFLARRNPARHGDGRWLRHAPTASFGREGVSLRFEIAIGTVLIYAEGREKTPGSAHPFWQARTSVHFDRTDAPLIELAAAGGLRPFRLGLLAAQPEMDGLGHRISEATDHRVMEDFLELPLDTFNEWENAS